MLVIFYLESVEGITPTVGFQPVELNLRDGRSIKIYDLGGGPRIRDIWHNYFSEIYGIICYFLILKMVKFEFLS